MPPHPPPFRPPLQPFDLYLRCVWIPLFPLLLPSLLRLCHSPAVAVAAPGALAHRGEGEACIPICCSHTRTHIIGGGHWASVPNTWRKHTHTHTDEKPGQINAVIAPGLHLGLSAGSSLSMAVLLTAPRGHPQPVISQYNGPVGGGPPGLCAALLLLTDLQQQTAPCTDCCGLTAWPGICSSDTAVAVVVVSGCVCVCVFYR